MAFVEIGGEGSGQTRPPIQKWQTIGQTVEGVYRGQREGKYGPLVVIQTPAGEVVYGAKAVLKSKLTTVKVGDLVRIEYLGKRKSAAGTEYGDFKVMVDSQPQGNQSATPPPVDQAEFDRLAGLIRAAKGDVIANAMASAAKFTGDPVGSLRSAMDQLGVVSF